MNATLAIGATLFLGTFYSWTSRINGMFFFGRSAGAELRDSAEAGIITRQYVVSVIATTCGAILLAWLGGLHGRHFAAVGLLVECAVFWAIFARANRRVRALEVSRGENAERESIVQVPLLETPSYRVPTSPMTLLPAFLGAIAFAAALLLAGYGTDLHLGWSAWNASVEARHLDGLFGMSIGLLGAASVLLIVFRSTVRLRTRMAQYTVRASIVMEWIGLTLLLTVLGANYLGLALSQHTNKFFMVAGVVAVLGTTVWNQARAKRFVPPPVELGADDRWRWGLFYVDRNDPAVFVQSRCGAGYTLNYGRIVAWPISLALVAYFIAMVFLTSRH